MMCTNATTCSFFDGHSETDLVRAEGHDGTEGVHDVGYDELSGTTDESKQMRSEPKLVVKLESEMVDSRTVNENELTDAMK